MLYTIRHITTYSYKTDVSVARCVLHLLPISEGRQRVLSATLAIEPKPVEAIDATDFFGNRTAHIRLAGPSPRHRFESRIKVEVRSADPPHALLTPGWDEVRRAALAVADLSAHAPAHHLFASRYVPLLAAARDYAALSFAPGRPVLDAAIELMRRIHDDFVYDPEATDVSTPLDEVAAKRHGVCQDFAHWMIAGPEGAGHPGRLCLGLSAHPAAAGQAARSSEPMPPMPGCRSGAAPGSAGSTSTRPMPWSSARIMSAWPSGAIMPTSRRSTA